MTEKVTLELGKNYTFRLAGRTKLTDLNPKELLLYSTAMCAAMTIAAMMRKESLKPVAFELAVSGQLNTETVMAQSIYTSFHVSYNVNCNTIEEQAKVSRAVNLTNDKYCGLLNMLRMIAPVSHEISIVSTQTVKA